MLINIVLIGFNVKQFVGTKPNRTIFLKEHQWASYSMRDYPRLSELYRGCSSLPEVMIGQALGSGEHEYALASGRDTLGGE